MQVEGELSDETLRRLLVELSPPAFEQLTFELAATEYPGVIRVAAPDGGADAVLQATNGQRSIVFQSKRHTRSINWNDCEESLDTALAVWKPRLVVFVFPIDLSSPSVKTFKARLGESAAARTSKTTVAFWNASELVRRLRAAPSIQKRFFAPPGTSLVAELGRTVSAGGQLQSGADLVQRARTLAEFVDESDFRFKFNVQSSSADGPSPVWPETPYVVISSSDGTNRVEITAWSRDGAEVGLPSVGFTADERGEAARATAIEAWLDGRDALLDGGVAVRTELPEALSSLIEQATGAARVRIPPSAPVHTTINIATASSVRTYEGPFFLVPPRHGGIASLVGRVQEAALEINIRHVEGTEYSAHLALTGTFGKSARRNFDTAQLMLDWVDQAGVEIDLGGLTSIPIAGKLVTPPDKRDELERLVTLYADLVGIEEHARIRFELPDVIEADELSQIRAIAVLLETGHGRTVFREATGVIDDPNLIGIAGELLREHGRTTPYSPRALGSILPIGTVHWDLPPLAVTRIEALGPGPMSPARVTAAPVGDGITSFHLASGPSEAFRAARERLLR